MPLASKSAKADKTRNDIVRAAEKLFAEKGFRAMTLRDVTRQAHVNLAAVNYHFGSKRELMLAVIRNRFEPINVERLRRLDALVSEHQPQPIPVDAIFAALFGPLFESANTEHGPDYALMQLIGRAITEPADFMRSMHKVFFNELSQRFMTELRRSCPRLSEEALQYRFFFVINTMLGTIIEQVRLENLSGGTLDATDFDKLVKQLTDFAVAGFIQTDATP
jgi:AcrR family transcriptional regulator